MQKYSVLLLLFLLGAGCTGPGKLQTIQNRQLAARLALSRSELAEERKVIRSGSRDTLRVTDAQGGNELILMKAVKDEDTGEMVASEVIDAAVITARFRNVAERHGRVDLRFEVIVPPEMMDSKWQLVFQPDMYLLGDSLRLEPVIITGADFRKTQLRGYELYDKYLRSIITDSAAFVDWRNVHIWISRNLPELARFRSDSSFVEEDSIRSVFGPTQREAILHYTWGSRKRYHEKLWAERGKKFGELVKAPIRTEGIRLDTVLRDLDGNFVYQYTQSVRTRSQLRKVEVVLSGDIYEQDRHLYRMPRSEPLTFYISSLSSLADGRERYLTRVLERKAAANTACYVDFAQGKADIDLSLGHNREEMGRIRENILELLGNDSFEMDSIVISASASPEGSAAANHALARKRAAAVADYFERYVRHYRDSVRRNGFSMTLDEDGRERRVYENPPDIRFRSRSNGENWPYLSVLVVRDSLLSAADKRSYAEISETADADARERRLQETPYYRYLREKLYPRLRTVRFDFYLHRKGMLKDTVHTTETDTAYMRGVRFLQEREYEKALGCLREYRDYNTAVAYLALDYNASALSILKDLPESPQVHYMLALLYARGGDDAQAVRHYGAACREDRSFVFRGNLDPEIYLLIQRYGLNRETDEPAFD